MAAHIALHSRRKSVAHVFERRFGRRQKPNETSVVALQDLSTFNRMRTTRPRPSARWESGKTRFARVSDAELGDYNIVAYRVLATETVREYRKQRVRRVRSVAYDRRSYDRRTALKFQRVSKLHAHERGYRRILLRVNVYKIMFVRAPRRVFDW